ncbi:hypothetical protein JKY72_03765 [Candidatus Gracilibacteria bacterium]|nr:hypothetical protein [Candidatus Gracilibacteria bacterium]
MSSCTLEIDRIESPQTVSAETARLVVDMMATVGHKGSCDELRELAMDQFILVVNLDTVEGLSADLIDGRSHGAVKDQDLESGERKLSFVISEKTGGSTQSGDFRGTVSGICTP